MFHPSPSVGSLVIAVAFRPLELWFITPCARLCYLKYGPGSGIDFLLEGCDTLGLIPRSDFYRAVIIYDNERALSAHMLETV